MKFIYIQNWMDRDRDSGPEDGGWSVHLTEADAKAFAGKLINQWHQEYLQRGGTGVPSYYTTTDGDPRKVYVPDDVYEICRQACAGARGVWGGRFEQPPDDPDQIGRALTIKNTDKAFRLDI